MIPNQNQFIYHCQNEGCSYSGKKGYQIALTSPNITACPYCGNNSLKPKVKGIKIATGGGGGALLGFTVGGPIGAIVFGLIGLGIGAWAENQENKK